MSKKILFLCTGNSCRSQMAEALLRHICGDAFESLSAGSQPAGFIHPLAEAAMENLGISLAGQSSKSWDEFADVPIDVVITLCDSAAAETCPNWIGSPLAVHWSMPDPAFHLGDEAERIEFASRVAKRLEAKIRGLVALDWNTDRIELQKHLERLGEI